MCKGGGRWVSVLDEVSSSQKKRNKNRSYKEMMFLCHYYIRWDRVQKKIRDRSQENWLSEPVHIWSGLFVYHRECGLKVLQLLSICDVGTLFPAGLTGGPILNVFLSFYFLFSLCSLFNELSALFVLCWVFFFSRMW